MTQIGAVEFKEAMWEIFKTQLDQIREPDADDISLFNDHYEAEETEQEEVEEVKPEELVEEPVESDALDDDAEDDVDDDLRRDHRPRPTRETGEIRHEAKGQNFGGDQSGQNHQAPTAELFAMTGEPAMSGQVWQSDGIAATEVAADGSVNIGEIAQKLVDRLLVSDPAAGDRREVRLVLKNDILPGTEVRFEQVEGRFEIQLVTSDRGAREFLEGQREDLQELLSQRLDSDVQVSLG